MRALRLHILLLKEICMCTHACSSLHIFLIKEICMCTHACSSATHILNKRNVYVYTCVLFGYTYSY